MTDGYEFRSSEAEPQGSGPPLPASEEPKKGKGRPLGSKNKAGADARALLATGGMAGIRTLCRIAALKPVYRPLKGGGRERMDPTIPDALAALKIIVGRLVPELKATELTGKDGEPLLPAEPSNPRELAKSILEVFRQAVPGGNVALTEPGEHTATFRDPDLARRLDIGERASESPKPAARTFPYTIAGRAVIAHHPDRNGHQYCVCRTTATDALQWFATAEDAEETALRWMSDKKI